MDLQITRRFTNHTAAFRRMKDATAIAGFASYAEN
jgi:hypothetical protein